MILLSLCIVFICCSIGCKKGFEARYGPFYIMSDTSVYFEGDMGSRIDNQFDRMICDYPNINSITFSDYCPGSRNDEQLFIAARRLRLHEVATRLTDESIIESGAGIAGNSGIPSTAHPSLLAAFLELRRASSQRLKAGNFATCQC